MMTSSPGPAGSPHREPLRGATRHPDRGPAATGVTAPASSGGAPPPPRELVGSWLVVVAGIAAASALASVEPTGLLRGNLAGVAALLFVLVPDLRLRARGEGWDAYGLPWWG